MKNQCSKTSKAYLERGTGQRRPLTKNRTARSAHCFFSLYPWCTKKPVFLFHTSLTTILHCSTKTVCNTDFCSTFNCILKDVTSTMLHVRKQLLSFLICSSFLISKALLISPSHSSEEAPVSRHQWKKSYGSRSAGWKKIIKPFKTL